MSIFPSSKGAGPLDPLDQEMNVAATKVQANFRGNQDREKVRKEKMAREEAATRILGKFKLTGAFHARNGWEWGNGMTIIFIVWHGSFPHSLLSTSQQTYGISAELSPFNREKDD